MLKAQGYTTTEIAETLNWSRGNAWRALTGRQFADVESVLGAFA